MKRRAWATVVALCAAWFARCDAARAAESAAIPPAVVRVMAAENGGASLGSGALVAVNERNGLVVTNWHVVRDTNGFIVVTFPDGFRSAATVVRVDRDWDLAALVIQRPNVAPLPLAAEPPRPGDWLAIAGYGKGSFRLASGRCTQYLSPGGRLPYEMVEVGTPAREGDSGGPIFNQRGELAGVLFGTGMGRTMGSYCGRVRWFLEPIAQQMQQMDQAGGNGTMIAQGQPSSATPARRDNAVVALTEPPHATPWSPAAPRQPPPLIAARPVEPYARPAPGWRGPEPPAKGIANQRGALVAAPPSAAAPPVSMAAPPPAKEPSPAGASDGQPPRSPDVPQADRFAGLKTILAVAGAMLMTFHAVRFLGRAVG